MDQQEQTFPLFDEEWNVVFDSVTRSLNTENIYEDLGDNESWFPRSDPEEEDEEEFPELPDDPDYVPHPPEWLWNDGSIHSTQEPWVFDDVKKPREDLLSGWSPEPPKETRIEEPSASSSSTDITAEEANVLEAVKEWLEQP